MTQNMGFADRLIRVLLAVTFATLYFTGFVPAGTLATILWIFGVIFLLTAAIGFCPLYRIFHLSSLRKAR